MSLVRSLVRGRGVLRSQGTHTFTSLLLCQGDLHSVVGKDPVANWKPVPVGGQAQDQLA